MLYIYITVIRSSSARVVSIARVVSHVVKRDSMIKFDMLLQNYHAYNLTE